MLKNVTQMVLQELHITSESEISLHSGDWKRMACHLKTRASELVDISIYQKLRFYEVITKEKVYKNCVSLQNRWAFQIIKN